MPDGEQKPRLAEAQALIAPSTERGGTEFRQVSRPGSGFQALPPAHAGASRQCTPMKAFPPWGELFPVLDVGAGPLTPAIGLRILGHTVRS
ncbi:MAG: hypothetical protein DUD39_09465 [Coriobacteriaceae bacterium]|nr:MAG: hypothetical protein DUD39_09465 [Coriobacteriaceae bacterium]